MKIKNKTFCKKNELHLAQKYVRIFKENVNELHFCNSEAYTEIS